MKSEQTVIFRQHNQGKASPRINHPPDGQVLKGDFTLLILFHKVMGVGVSGLSVIARIPFNSVLNPQYSFPASPGWV
jgi:hypothetical protein